ncbi:uncharacterized protein [Hyperolius riggenbachi]|uniref:uncharacterized protein isoform X3 n=1 Tax=Hyperolius riggenbachi TaxID=752182 RepID=UPI0035A28F38
MARRVRDALIAALENLDHAGFKKFCSKLAEWDIQRAYSRIPWSKLEKADPEDVVGLILAYYNDDYGTELTLAILDAINEKQVAEELKQHLTNGNSVSEHFLDKYYMDLIRQAAVVGPILDHLLEKNLLTHEQYDAVCSKSSSQEKMMKLLHYARGWSNPDKDILYELLKDHNEELIQYLAHRDKLSNLNHFVDRHRESLIQQGDCVNAVLHGLLRKKLLTQEQYDAMRSLSTSQKKMQQLYSYIGGWKNSYKDMFYDILKKHNARLIQDLESWDVGVPPTPSLEHFLDRHRALLICRMSEIQPIMDELLLHNLLTEEQYDTVMSHRVSQERMRKLYSYIPAWSKADKDAFYYILKRHNGLLVRDLEEQDVRRPQIFKSPSMLNSQWTPKGLLQNSLEGLSSNEFKYFKYKLSDFTYENRSPIPRGKLEDADVIYVWNLLIDHYGEFSALEVTMQVLNSFGLMGSAEDLQRQIKSSGLRTPEVILPYILDKLKQFDFKQFKLKLSELCKEGKRPILQRLLDSADRITTMDLIRLLYEQEEVLDMAIKILKMTNNEQIASDLQNWIPLTGNKNSRSSQDIQPGSPAQPDQNSKQQSGAESLGIKLLGKTTEEDWESPTHLRNELECPLCKETFNDPVTLHCGHNFCKGCIETWDSQKQKESSCPLCREKFREMPKINRILREVSVYCKSTKSNQKTSQLNCTYCIHDSVPAVKSCVLCEASLCNDHLGVHCRGEEHLMVKPTTLLQKTKCPLHHKIMDFYCVEEAICICSSCLLLEEHRGHHEETIKVAAEKKKTNLRNDQEQLNFKKKKLEECIIHYRRTQGKPVSETEMPPDKELFGESSHEKLSPEELDHACCSKTQTTVLDGAQTICDTEMVEKLLEVLELQVPGRSSTQEHQTVFSLSDIVQRAEERMDQLSLHIDVIEELCQETDPFLVLHDQTQESCREESQPEAASCPLEDDSAPSSLFNNMSCTHCGQNNNPADIFVVPSTHGNKFRLELKSAGLFCCQTTGIKFQVTGPVVIHYNLESWIEHLKEPFDEKYEVIGPLFRIDTSVTNVVSAVYLPHYLCLKSFTGDKSVIKCAHFTDVNMSLETPTQVEPFHISLKNPTFSCLGPLLFRSKKKTPIHGIVLIYFRMICPGDPECEERKIHLYLLPLVAQIEQNLDKKKMNSGFQRVDKPPHPSDRVYSKLKYLITGHPGASILPKTLQFQTIHPSEPYQFTEIKIKQRECDITLHVAEDSTKETVWETEITRGDIKDITISTLQLTVQEGASLAPQHFVDRHRTALIARLSHVEPILDDLLELGLLETEQYDTICKKKPHQKKMRKLYEYVPMWSNTDKDKLYQAMQKSNAPLIVDLECGN